MSGSENIEVANYEVQITTELAKKHKIPNIIGQPKKIDAWCHHRMYNFLQPLYSNYADKKWLTIGDSGADAFAYKRRGVKSIVSSSLSSARLQSLKDNGLLEDIEIKALNAEQTGEPDGSYDVVTCKQAYHHFPRAPIGFYELLRIARQVVAYDEPNCDGRRYILDEARTLVKKIIRGEDRSTQKFERAGNFIYRLSVKEAIKIATAMQLPMVAYKHCNDFFVMSLADKDQSAKGAWLLIKLGIVVQSVLCHLRLMSWGRVILLVFKEQPSEKTLSELRSAGFRVEEIPRNPYL